MVSTTERANVGEILDHPFLASGETKAVMPDLLASQVPEYQHVPLGLITVERSHEDEEEASCAAGEETAADDTETPTVPPSGCTFSGSIEQ